MCNTKYNNRDLGRLSKISQTSNKRSQTSNKNSNFKPTLHKHLLCVVKEKVIQHSGKHQIQSYPTFIENSIVCQIEHA